jgi:hypothetical protein
MRNAYRMLIGILKERNHLEVLRVGGKVILKWIFKKTWRENVDWIPLA